ncbi:MAG TPA: patatin-like phospholipase family protein, partial [Longimicrobiales bacterium]|nr:patatin-like phospholipase family protein [Longimicrobiales bacterium]
MTPEPTPAADLALVLTGGGARGAYQVGLLRCLARHFPDLRIPIITGVSAGAVNAAQLASHHGTFPQAVTELAALWAELTPERVFRVDAGSLGGGLGRWLLRLVSGGTLGTAHVKSLVDTSPLREYLEETLAAVRGVLTGIDYNLERGVLKAVALSATNYTTGQSTVFVHGRDVQEWRRPQRVAVRTRMRVDHVMASAALPIFFPAVRIDDAYYGDGGIRATAPLSPAMHLGARRILAVSTRFHRSQQQADAPAVTGYPPPAQVVGVLMNAVFLDMIDQDMQTMERINRLIERMPPHQRGDVRPVHLLAVRPSQDLARLASRYEPHLPRAFRYLTRGLGTRETGS